MKDEMIAGILLILLLAMFWGNSHVMEVKTTKISSRIDRLDAGDEISFDDMDKICRLWNREKRLLMYLCAHGNILAIDECMEMGREYLEAGNEDAALLCLKKARHYLMDLKEREKIRLDNIF